MKQIVIEKDGPVTIVSIARQKVKNAVDYPTAVELAKVFKAFDADDSASVAVLTGSGGTFCSGADLKAMSDEQEKRVKVDGDGPMGPTRLQLSKPVIAAIEGHAVAGGLELALWCDLRVAASNAIFGVFCRRFGVPLVDGGTIRLPRLIGHSQAMDMILTGRPVQAEEAKQFGLVNRLVAPGQARAEAIELAKQISKLPQHCLRSDRLSAARQWHLSMEQALEEETRLGMEVIASGESIAGAEAFTKGEGRHGAFSNLTD